MGAKRHKNKGQGPRITGTLALSSTLRRDLVGDGAGSGLRIATEVASVGVQLVESCRLAHRACDELAAVSLDARLDEATLGEVANAAGEPVSGVVVTVSDHGGGELLHPVPLASGDAERYGRVRNHRGLALAVQLSRATVLNALCVDGTVGAVDELHPTDTQAVAALVGVDVEHPVLQEFRQVLVVSNERQEAVVTLDVHAVRLVNGRRGQVLVDTLLSVGSVSTTSGLAVNVHVLPGDSVRVQVGVLVPVVVDGLSVIGRVELDVPSVKRVLLLGVSLDGVTVRIGVHLREVTEVAALVRGNDVTDLEAVAVAGRDEVSGSEVDAGSTLGVDATVLVEVVTGGVAAPLAE